MYPAQLLAWTQAFAGVTIPSWTISRAVSGMAFRRACR